jgi:hypothetical protein
MTRDGTMARYIAPDGDAFYYSGDVNADWRRFVSLGDLINANRAAGHHFFDSDTLRWFGSRNRHIVAGALVETRMRAPARHLRYGVTWFDHEGIGITTATFPTLDQARSAARRVYRDGFARAGESSD